MCVASTRYALHPTHERGAHPVHATHTVDGMRRAHTVCAAPPEVPHRDEPAPRHPPWAPARAEAPAGSAAGGTRSEPERTEPPPRDASLAAAI